MPVKYWSFAGLMLTYWCNASCASCYLNCSPSCKDELSVEQALEIWRGLIEASPHGCRVHLTGGEPFGNWPKLLEICRRAKAQGLGPLVKVETNAFWATDAETLADRIKALDEAGMEKFGISADPYHQQFVPIEHCRLAAKIAQDILGPDRVQVRWMDWLKDGFDTADLSDSERADLFMQYACQGRDRMNGRAAELIAAHLLQKPATAFKNNPCERALLRSKHVHIGPDGVIMPGTCAGIILGKAKKQKEIAEIWKDLDKTHGKRFIVGTLSNIGPLGLLTHAKKGGYVEKKGYASKCHLCWDMRRHFSREGYYLDELGPVGLYDYKKKS